MGECCDLPNEQRRNHVVLCGRYIRSENTNQVPVSKDGIFSEKIE